MKARKIATAPGRGLKALSSMVFGRTSGLLWRFLPRTRFDYAREVGDGMGSSLIMAPILWMARTFPEAPIQVLDREGQPIEGHDMVELLRRPNQHYSGLVMWMALLLSWVIDGNAYLLKVRFKNTGGVGELWYVPHWLIEPKSDDPAEFVQYYEYKVDGQLIHIDVDDVVHLRYGLDPHNPRKGLSPLGSVLREVFSDDEAANFAAALLKNVGVPGLIVSPEKGSQTAPSTDDVKATKDYVKDNFTGDKRGQPLVMSGPTKVEQFGFSPEQMQVRDLRRVPEERVTAALGLPAIVVGFGAGLERSTFANFGEAREAAYESNMVPTWRLFAEELRNQLLPDFEQTPKLLEVAFDLKQVRALQEDRNKEAERFGTLYKDGVISRAEARIGVGEEATPADYVYAVPIATVLVPADQLPGDDEDADEAAADEETAKGLKARPLAKSTTQTGAMVALYPPAHVAAALAQEDGEPVEDLHLTLAFLGDAAAITDTERLLAVVAGFAATCGPLTGEVSGIGHFTAGPDPVTYASADVPGLGDLRSRLVEVLTLAGFPPAAEHGFTPHITLAYDYVEPEIANHGLSFGAITLVLGGERHDFVLSGMAPAKRRGAKGRGVKGRADQLAALDLALKRDEDRLAGVFAQELELDLDTLGQKAAAEYERLAPDLAARNGSATKADLHTIVERILTGLGIAHFVDSTLRARYATHYRRAAQQTVDTLNHIFKLDLELPAHTEAALVEKGADRVSLLELEGEARKAILDAIEAGRENGVGVRETAREIRSWVPAGRFRNAGPKYRAELIARTETLQAQRHVALAAYRESPVVSAAEAMDGRGGNSDAECAARDGEIFSFDEAEFEAANEHPNGTLAFAPVTA